MPLPRPVGPMLPEIEAGETCNGIKKKWNEDRTETEWMYCTRRPGWGTTHKGIGRCRDCEKPLHGNTTHGLNLPIPKANNAMIVQKYIDYQNMEKELGILDGILDYYIAENDHESTISVANELSKMKLRQHQIKKDISSLIPEHKVASLVQRTVKLAEKHIKDPRAFALFVNEMFYIVQSEFGEIIRVPDNAVRSET